MVIASIIVIVVVAIVVLGAVKNKKRKYYPAQTQCEGGTRRELTEQEKECLLAIFRRTTLPYIELRPVRKAVGVFDSKLGGIPYLPPGFGYPYNTSPKSGKKPLKLIAQLNFARLPHLEGFPREGILQFYIACEASDDVFGVNFEEPAEQDSWRIVYHKDIVGDESLLRSPPDLDIGDEAAFPFEGEFGLEARIGEMAITSSDFRWQDFLENMVLPSQLYQSLEGAFAADEITEELWDVSADWEICAKGGFRVGGYPNFTQEDPRRNGHGAGYTALLLQLDSWQDEEDAGIMFGDCGIANWFIKPEALANADFSDVLYTWDCC